MTIQECFDEFTRKGRKCIEVDLFTTRCVKQGHKPAEVLAFLDGLNDAGRLKHAFRVKDPEGVIIGEAYDKVEDIPSTVPNRFYSYYYPIEACDIVPVYQVVK